MEPYVRGAAHLMDMGGTLHPRLSDLPWYGDGGPEADARALQSDWIIVARDFPGINDVDDGRD